ncbi:aldo/keto reductase [Ravibacter arvi]|uniref:Aldo/keto reductase n=1 Tax=Ravibacter arvi TaxID=2051041 RepID=A0ABP8MDQ5_9BACT
MKKRSLGNTGLEVSEVAFGGVEIGMPYGIGNTENPSEKDAIRLLQTSLDNGINFFDTARLYGNSEQIMGKAFTGRRHEVILASKCRHFRDAGGALPPDALLKPFIENSLHESLEALQTDYIDVYMLHQADLEILSRPLIAEAFAELKKKGVIRATGASVYTPEETATAIRSGQWDVIQLPFNLMNQSHGACFEEAREKKVGVVVRSVLLKGLLSDRGKNLHPALREVEQYIDRYRQFTGGDYPDLPALATRFVLSFPEVASVLVGIDKMEYLQDALVTASYPDLGVNEHKQLLKLAYPDPDFLNLHHWDKMGWLK